MDENQDLEKIIKVLKSENRLHRKEKARLQDIIERQVQRHKDLERRLSIHPKTGLPNHNKLDYFLTDLLAEEMEVEAHKRLAIIIIKLDRKYEMVNKTLKTSIGEWVIYQVGNRLLETLKGSDKIFHTRDEEFILIINLGDEKDSLKRWLNVIHDAVCKPHVFSGYHISLGCHIGVALFPDHGLKKNDLLHNADIALEAAVQEGHTIQVFREDMRLEVVEKMELQNSILKALESQAIAEMDKQFEIYFQPQVQIRLEDGNRAIVEKVDAEVLLRWHHPQRGLLSPGHFIPIAEETGLIQPMGNWVFFRTIEQLQEWKNGPFRDVALSINISPKQFSNDLFLENIVRIIESRKLSYEKLKLELTESSLMDDPIMAIRKMNKLKNYGIQFLVDDFGSGYSSLNYLQKLPVSTIKIDRSFVTELGENKQDEAIVRAIIAMAKEIGFDIIVEGVEMQRQLKFLVNEGCSIIQGYYFSRPVPVNEFEEFVTKLQSGSIILEGDTFRLEC